MSDSMHMFGEHVETIPCGFGTSITESQCHSVHHCKPGFHLDLQICTNECDGKGMMGGLSPTPSHVNDVRHHVYMLKACGDNYKMVTAWWKISYPSIERPFHVGLEPQSLNHNVIQCNAGTIQDVNLLLKSGLINEIVTA